MLHVFAMTFFSAVLFAAFALLVTSLCEGWQDMRRALGLAEVQPLPRHDVRVRRTRHLRVLTKAPAPLRAAA